MSFSVAHTVFIGGLLFSVLVFFINIIVRNGFHYDIFIHVLYFECDHVTSLSAPPSPVPCLALLQPFMNVTQRVLAYL